MPNRAAGVSPPSPETLPQQPMSPDIEVEELELSADQVKINDQLQEDELLAMESIYGEKFVILERKQGLRSFQVRIDAKIPEEELTVTAKLTESTSGDDFSYSFKVKFLPPIVLTCTFPRSYPSHNPPRFTISVQWLDSIRISELRSALDSIWSGQEVVYQWVDWLQTNSLPHLGFHQEIILTTVSPDVDVPLLKRYNDEQGLERFLNSLHECSICFSEFPGSSFVRLSCEHYFCSNCMVGFSNMHVSEGTLYKLRCPGSKCGGIIPPSLLKQLLGDEEYERYESVLLEKSLECMTDAVCCPRCDTICFEDKQNFAHCHNCFNSFCSLCKDRRHLGVPCLNPELKMQILQGRLLSSQLNEKQRRAERNKINEFLSEREIARNTKQCPVCKMAISRTEGCNKMVCGNCGNYFCYLCSRSITGYDHFWNGECKLFPTEEIQRTNGCPTNVRIPVRINLGPVHQCARCTKMNTKADNNNYIHCGACRTHYCYLCRTVVKSFREHFGRNRCMQHTPG